MACHALPVANKGCIEDRMTGRIGATRLRWRSADHPAGHGGIINWNGSKPQKKGRHIRLLGGEQQFACGCQVKAFRIAPRRNDDSACSPDAKTVRRGFQDILRGRAAYDHEPFRIEAKILQPRRIGKAMFLRGKIFFQPNDGVLTRGSA